MPTPIWLRTGPAWRDVLAPVSFEAEGVWHMMRLYCSAVANNGILPKAELHVAVQRKIPLARARRYAAELATRPGILVEHAGHYELVEWEIENPPVIEGNASQTYNNQRRMKALHRDEPLKARIRTRDCNRCRYCGIRVNWADRKSPIAGQYDHVDPEGENTFANVVVACKRCNGRKGHQTPEQAGLVLLAAGSTGLDDPAGSSRNQAADLAGSDPDLDPGRISLVRTRDYGPGRIGFDPGPDPGQIVPPLPDPEHHVNGTAPVQPVPVDRVRDGWSLIDAVRIALADDGTACGCGCADVEVVYSRRDALDEEADSDG